MKLFRADHVGRSLDLHSYAKRTDLYLLDASYTVLGASLRCGEVPLGRELFALFSISAEERQLLCEYLWNPQGKNLLLTSPAVPLLVLGGFFLQTGVFAVLVPEDGVAQSLHGPAPFAVLTEQLYNGQSTSCAQKEYSVEECEVVLRWYRAVTAPFRCMEEAYGAEILSACILCADQLARICDCCFESDLDGMDVHAEDRFLPGFYTAVLTAAMLACRRCGQGNALKIFAQRCYGVGPVMYVRIWLRDAADPLPEFSAIARAARSRGVFFDVRPSGALEGETDIRVSLCPVDLCAVGIREVGAIPAGRCVFDLIPLQTQVAYTSRLALDGIEEISLI